MSTTNVKPRGWTIGAYVGLQQYACRKVPYKSEGAALAHVRASERREHGWNMQPYRCARCHRWHVGGDRLGIRGSDESTNA